MRIAHVTDVHWQTTPRLRDLCQPRRVLGSANLYLRGRRTRFARDVQDRLMGHLESIQADMVLVTGDLTAQALVPELEAAREGLLPTLEASAALVIPGNHDAYCHDAVRDRRFEQHFGPWMHPYKSIARLDHGDVTVLGLDPNRPLLIRASGVVPDAQLQDLQDTLNDDDLKGRCVVLALHYPIVDRRGEVYDGENHGLLNARDLIQILAEVKVKPAWVVHGHEHHGYRAQIEAGGVSIPSFDCGSSGTAYRPDLRRYAAMNVYTVEDRRLVSIDRYLDQGTGFALEEGGAYATGR